MFLVYETKFTVGKSQEMVFTSVQGRGEVVGGNSTLAGNPPRDVYIKQWALQQLENLLASKHWG